MTRTTEISNGHNAGTSNVVTISNCYVAGALIRIVDGDVVVQKLAIGDLVVTASGEHRPILWIGRQKARVLAVAEKRQALPICFEAGALGENAPRHDPWISPNHSLFLGGFLVAARDLVNATSIR